MEVFKIKWQGKKLKFLNGIIVFYISLFLHACSFIRNEQNVINFIRSGSLRNNNEDANTNQNELSRLFQLETNRDIRNLKNNGFLVGPRYQIPNRNNNGYNNFILRHNRDIKKHIMFVAFHTLRLEQEGMPIRIIFDFFETQRNTHELMYRPEMINRGEIGGPGIKFVFPHLMTDMDLRRDRNIETVRGRRTPNLVMRGNMLVIGGDENINPGVRSKVVDIQVDHLLRTDRYKIEMPAEFHHIKTTFLDKMISRYEGEVTRRHQAHWAARLRALNL